MDKGTVLGIVGILIVALVIIMLTTGKNGD